MIPLVSTDTELKILRTLVKKIAKKIELKNKTKLDYIVGTMIELPRAKLYNNKAQNQYQNTQIF